MSRVGELLVITIAVSGDLHRELGSQGNAVRFRSSGDTVLQFAGLRAWDARGRVLPPKLEVRKREAWLVVNDRMAEYPLVIDPVWNQDAKLTSSDRAEGDEFGVSAVVSGNTAVVGAHYKNIGLNSSKVQPMYLYAKPMAGRCSRS